MTDLLYDHVMTDAEFWDLMSKRNMTAIDQEDCYSGVAPIVDALSKADAKSIQSFHELLSQKLYALDHEDRLNESCGSGDGFLYQRCYLVAQCRETFEMALKDVSHNPGDYDWCESLLYVAPQAWEASQSGEWDFEPSVSYETGSHTANYSN